MGTQLVLTVGTNPLPVWVAWYHLKGLLPPPVTVKLVHTANTMKEKDRLQEHCGGIPSTHTYQTSAGDPGKVRDDIMTNLVTDLPNDEKVHVHYTGGTKVMGVETVAAIEDFSSSRQVNMKTSYLDPREAAGPTIVDWDGTRLIPDTRMNVEPDLRTIAKLNGFELGPFNHTYWNREVGREVTDHCPGPGELTEEQMRDGNGALGEFIAEADFHLLEHGAYAALKAALERICQTNSRRCNYQLFHNVYVRRSNNVNNPKIRPFELDVVAVLGYQIIVVSCTVSGGADEVKEKGMEAILRARQLGGDEARATVLCSVHRNQRPYIEAELQDETGSSDLPLQIWGRDKWKNLSNEFYNYLCRDLHWR